MKFFAKYINLPGEVNIGDTFYECNGKHPNYYNVSDIKNGYVYTSPLSFRFKINECKKVKLFICSKETYHGEPPQGQYIDSKISGIEQGFMQG